MAPVSSGVLKVAAEALLDAVEVVVVVVVVELAVDDEAEAAAGVGAGPGVGVAEVLAEVAARARSCWLTTAEYCCISITAASKRTWMLRRHLILASTLTLSVPSIALSSSSVRPEKFVGGIGGGIPNGGINIGGGMNNGGTPDVVLVVLDEVVVDVVVVELDPAVDDAVGGGCCCCGGGAIGGGKGSRALAAMNCAKIGLKLGI